MRLGLLIVLLLAPGHAFADASAPVWNARAASILLHAHPHAWQPPIAASVAAGMTLGPETGAAVTLAPADLRSGAAYRSALASIPVQSRADGSKFAVLGGLVRAYMVASVSADGRLVQHCVDSEPQALERIRAAARAAAQVSECDGH